MRKIKTYKLFLDSKNEVPNFEYYLEPDDGFRRAGFGTNGVFTIHERKGVWIIVGYALRNEWSGKNLGEDFMIYNLNRLSKFGVDEIYSIDKYRNKYANNLWDKLSKRKDVIVTKTTLDGNPAHSIKLSNKLDESILDVFRSDKGKVKSLIKSLGFIDNKKINKVGSNSITTNIEFDDSVNKIYIHIQDSLNSLQSGLYIKYNEVTEDVINYMIYEYMKFYKETWVEIMYIYDSLDYLFQPIYDLGCRYYNCFILDVFRKKLFIELEGDLQLISESDELKHISERLLPNITLDKIYPSKTRTIICYNYKQN